MKSVAVADLSPACNPVASTPASSHRTTVDRIFGDGPRWMFLAVLVYAPWAYGCTREWTIQILNCALYSVVAWWLIGCAVRRAWPRVHPVLLVAVTLLLIQGWWMTLNSGWSYDDALRPGPRANWSHALPGAVDYAAAYPTMVGVTAMLGAVCLACDVGCEQLWRRRLWLTIALTGASVVLLGLVQKVTHAPGIFWRSEGHAPTFFGPYRYHANAGAFINLVWPLIAAFLVRSFRRNDSPGFKAFWATAFAVSIAAALANTSRASSLIAMLMLVVWAGWGTWEFLKQRSERIQAGPVIAVALLLTVMVLTVVGLGGLDTAVRRWTHIDQEFSWSNSRLMGARVCLDMVPQSGWFGFGPGTFRTAFPFFNKDASEATRGVWLQAHQDYLQALVEWGWVGAAVIGVLMVGAIARTITERRKLNRMGRSDQYMASASVAGLFGVLTHAMVDFPLQIGSIQFYFAVLIGISWGFPRWRYADGDGGKVLLARATSDLT